MEISNKEMLIAAVKELATPIDFAKLEKEGIIGKSGVWFKVKDIRALPEYAAKQVKARKTDNKGNCLVQFQKSWKTAQKLYRELTGRNYDE